MTRAGAHATPAVPPWSRPATRGQPARHPASPIAPDHRPAAHTPLSRPPPVPRALVRMLGRILHRSTASDDEEEVATITFPSCRSKHAAKDNLCRCVPDWQRDKGRPSGRIEIPSNNVHYFCRYHETSNKAKNPTALRDAEKKVVRPIGFLAFPVIHQRFPLMRAATRQIHMCLNFAAWVGSRPRPRNLCLAWRPFQRLPPISLGPLSTRRGRGVREGATSGSKMPPPASARS